MLQLLKIEWMKIRSYKAFKVFSILYILSLLGTIFMFYKIYENFVLGVTGSQSMADRFNPFAIDYVWGNAAFSLGFLIYLPGMIIINLCVNEFNFKTHRQNIIDGWRRTDFLKGKFFVLLSFSIVITIVYVLSVFIFCAITKTAITYIDYKMIFGFFLQTFTYLLFAFTLAILFRKSGVAIIIFFIYGLVVENMLSGLLNWKASPIGYFLPLQSADILTPGSIKSPTGGALSMYNEAPNYYIIVATVLGYCGLCIFLSYKKFIKDDL
jgi:ABC-2 type transport system permease protein